jgi:hypothetical protein
MEAERGSLVSMPLHTCAEYDAALGEAIDSLPAWAVTALADAVIRVEQAPHPGGLETVPGLRLVVYRHPSIWQARDHIDLARLARADLVRALVWQLDLDDEHADQLGGELVAS